jgi:hypothetical protein
VWDCGRKLKIGDNRWLSNPRWRSLRIMQGSDRTNIRTYRESFQGIGCRTGCMTHLALLGLLCLAALVWAVKNRAWELSVTVEMPATKAVEEQQPEMPPEK